MLILTDRAVAVLKTVCETGGLRIGVDSSGCSGLQYKMALESDPTPDDEILDLSGIRVFVDPASSLWLAGVIVDFVDGVGGGGFQFENPNAKGKCSCSGSCG
jgi:iron-sulfur cluster assembly protein